MKKKLAILLGALSLVGCISLPPKAVFDRMTITTKSDAIIGCKLLSKHSIYDAKRGEKVQKAFRQGGDTRYYPSFSNYEYIYDCSVITTKKEN